VKLIGMQVNRNRIVGLKGGPYARSVEAARMRRKNGIRREQDLSRTTR
jgi:hypothetical protein